MLNGFRQFQKCQSNVSDDHSKVKFCFRKGAQVTRPNFIKPQTSFNLQFSEPVHFCFMFRLHLKSLEKFCVVNFDFKVEQHLFDEEFNRLSVPRQSPLESGSAKMK